MGDRILITGAGGFIGRYLIKELQSRNVDFLLLDSYAAVVENVQTKDTSILDFESLKEIFLEYKPTVVIHLAAIASPTHGNVAEIYNVNVCGTENLFKALTMLGLTKTRVILVSSAGVYGNHDIEYYDEEVTFNPQNHYSYSKMITEFLARQYDELDIKIVRPFNIIGKGQKNTFLIPKVVEHFGMKKREIHLGNINAIRDYVNVEYCVYALVELALRKSVNYSILNICSGQAHSVADILDILEELTGYRPIIVIDEQFIRKNEVWRMVGSTKHLDEFLDNYKCEDIRTVLGKMLEEYK